MAQMELKKGLSTTVLYVGLLILAIGTFMTFKPKPIFGGMAIMIAGTLVSLFWVANRNDEMCPTDPNDESPCTPVK